MTEANQEITGVVTTAQAAQEAQAIKKEPTVPHVSVPTALVQAIYQYLYNRPMAEVEGLVAGLRQLAPPSAPSN